MKLGYTTAVFATAESEMKVPAVMGKRMLAVLAAALIACACALVLVACGSSDKADLVGEWKISGTEVTVVFSDTEFKLVGNTFEYTLDDGKKTITYSSGGAKGSAQYSFSDNKQQLTLKESDGAGGTKTTVFNKVSSNGDAQPSAGVTAAPAQEQQSESQSQDNGEE